MDVFEKTDKFIMNTYKRFHVFFTKGEGVYLFDDKNNRYLDFLAGIAVNILGHSHKVITQAIEKQSKKLIHVSNLYYIKEQADLACLLIENSCSDKVFFSNSGAEANEAAVKLARLYGKKERYKIITMKNSFHGRTITTLSATGQTKYQKGFEPMTPGFFYAQFNDFEDLKKQIDDKTCAVIVEFIQGEGGINTASSQYISDTYKLCKEKDILFIADEIQTGMGRTGKLFAYEHYGVEPDIITMAKALGGGLPIGATLAKEEIAKVFTYGTHGSTFGGSPFVSYVAFNVLKYVLEEGLAKKAEEKGNYLIKNLKSLIKNKKDVAGIDGFGLIIGLHTKSGEYANELVLKALENKILIGKAGDCSIRFEPPLIVEKEHIDTVLEFLDKNL